MQNFTIVSLVNLLAVSAVRIEQSMDGLWGMSMPTIDDNALNLYDDSTAMSQSTSGGTMTDSSINMAGFDDVLPSLSTLMEGST